MLLNRTPKKDLEKIIADAKLLNISERNFNAVCRREGLDTDDKLGKAQSDYNQTESVEEKIRICTEIINELDVFPVSSRT